MGFLPSNWSGFPVKFFPSSNSMTWENTWKKTWKMPWHQRFLDDVWCDFIGIELRKILGFHGKIMVIFGIYGCSNGGLSNKKHGISPRKMMGSHGNSLWSSNVAVTHQLWKDILLGNINIYQHINPESLGICRGIGCWRWKTWEDINMCIYIYIQWRTPS